VPRLRAGSLCTGYGGLDLAVLAVLDTALAWCAETDRHASAVLSARFPAVPNFGDLTAVDWAAVPPVDLVTAGFPCQDISTAGRGAGIKEGTRSGLWTHIAQALGQLRPSYVLVENVAALRTRGLSRVLADLSALGYDPRWVCLRASDIGAAHRRDRIFILGWQPAALPRLLAAACPAAGAFNDTESLESWQARRERQKKLGRNGNGMGAPLGIAMRLLPTPTAVTTWRTPAEHMAWRHENGRNHPCDLQVAVVLQTAPHAPGEPGGALPVTVGGPADRMLLPTPDTGTSPRGHGRRGGSPGNGHQSGQRLDAVARTLHPPPASVISSPPAGTGRPASMPPAATYPGGRRPQAPSTAVAWGPYEAAIRRWEHALGRPAPPPAEPGPGGRPRLSAVFTEWLMGISPGWVTGVPGIPRTAQLRIIGNGVVPQQAAAALLLLIETAAAIPSGPGLTGADREVAA
jgi:DNA (cytosine-5)-methyltransferase 1